MRLIVLKAFRVRASLTLLRSAIPAMLLLCKVKLASFDKFDHTGGSVPAFHLGFRSSEKASEVHSVLFLSLIASPIKDIDDWQCLK